MRFAIAAGGTGGHLFPGLAVAEVLHSRGHEVMVMTSEKQIDSVATEGRSEFRVERLPGMGLPRGLSLQTLKCGWRFLSGLKRCLLLFEEYEPEVVLGMGGFTSMAPILAGRMRSLPTYVHESNAIPGKANRFNARIADGMLVGLRECADRLLGASCIFTGTPVRRTLQNRPQRSDVIGRFNLDSGKKTILVMGGSQGARGINEAMVGAAGGLSNVGCQIIHLTGAAEEDRVRDGYRRVGIGAWVAPFHHAMEELYALADVAVARSGAASLTELAHFRIPSVLIPYPFAADDHQTENARVFEKAGAAVIIREREANAGRLRAELERVLGEDVRSAMAKACEGLVEERAAERVADVLVNAVDQKGGQNERG